MIGPRYTLFCVVVIYCVFYCGGGGWVLLAAMWQIKHNLVRLLPALDCVVTPSTTTSCIYSVRVGFAQRKVGVMGSIFLTVLFMQFLQLVRVESSY